MSKQIYKGFREANTRLAELEHMLKNGHSWAELLNCRFCRSWQTSKKYT
jgi:hypothetical protein